MFARKKIFTSQVWHRAQGLLDMLYTPDNLADELGIPQREVYRKLIPAGLPHTKDATGHLWLHGLEVRGWIGQRRSRPHCELKEGQAFCFKCRRPVTIANPIVYQVGRVTVLKGQCPECGKKVGRGVKRP